MPHEIIELGILVVKKKEGDGQIPAQLFYQKVPGGRYNQAASSAIYYNTQTGAVKGEGIQDFSLFLSPKQQNGDNSPYN